jgi:hypothetical protein
MKTLDLSAVTPSVGIIPQKDTVEHITSSYLEGVASLAKSMIPTSWLTGKLVILHGCVATGTNPGSRTLTAGAVFYNGEVYQVPSASFTTTGSEIGVWTLQDVNTGTESKLTDGSDVHVLVDNKFVFAAGLSGSGDFDEDSIDVIAIGREYYGQYTKLFSSATFTGCTIFDSVVIYSINNNRLEYKLFIRLDVANATLLNISSNVEIVGSLVFNTNYGTGLSSDEIKETGNCRHVTGTRNYGIITLTYDTTDVNINGLILGRTVTNGDLIDVNINGSYQLYY